MLTSPTLASIEVVGGLTIDSAYLEVPGVSGAATGVGHAPTGDIRVAQVRYIVTKATQGKTLSPSGILLGSRRLDLWAARRNEKR